MKTYIALFRGINVGGNHSLKMKDLVALLETLGADGVKTYIQSGNVVFRHRKADRTRLSGDISAAIRKSHGFEPRVLLLDLEDVESAVAANPFPEAESDPRSLHLYFPVDKVDSPDLESLESYRKDNERFELKDGVFYLHAPDGIGRSKLAERVNKALGVGTTTRNWRTVCRIMELAQ